MALVERQRSSHRFSAVDLFAGPGGLGEGFSRAAFELVASVECDPHAVLTLRTRIAYRELEVIGKPSLYWSYVRGEVDFGELLERFGEIDRKIGRTLIPETISEDTRGRILDRIVSSYSKEGFAGVNVLLGGPPCQLYSLAGRARYSSMPEKYNTDPRIRLFEHYVYYLQELQPDIFVFENVYGITSSRLEKKHIPEILLEEFDNAGYEVPALEAEGSNTFRNCILNSVSFGVPQIRKRLILIGIRKDIARLSTQARDRIRSFYEEFSGKADENFSPVTVREAISDLPPLRPGEGSDRWFGPYESAPVSEYSKLMRQGSEGVINHRARNHMDSDLERYRYFIEHAAEGRRVTLEDLKRERPDLLPKHRKLDIFLDRFKVQMWDKPSSTITSHLSKDGHYYIHPDISQLRSFTVREAARCQSFPDSYLFEGPRTEQFRQVGNAVPPLMSEKIALRIREALDLVERARLRGESPDDA